MQELTRTLSLEQPKINAEIERHTGALPAGTRPVAEYVLLAGGKRLRPLLTLLAGRALGSRSEALYTLGAAIEMLHAATLLHDDILDGASLRRGRPAAHTVYGTAPVILAGDAMLAKAMLMVSAFGDTRLTDCISEAVMRTAEGEIAEFALLGNLDASHEDYLAVITGKTAWMLRASCELGALLAGVDRPLVEAAATFGQELGIAFQMVDDALDFSPPAATGKPRGGDVREGKVTPPLLSYRSSLSVGAASLFSQRFMERCLDESDVEAVSEAIYSGGHAEKTRRLAEAHLARSGAALELFPDSAERIVLRQMLSYIQHREK